MSKTTGEKTKKLKDNVTEVNEEEVTYWHKGRKGIIHYIAGTDATGKPIEKKIEFINHIFKTTDTALKAHLDILAERSPHILKRYNEYEIAKLSEPREIIMDIGGKKVRVPVEAMKESYLKEYLLEEETEEVKTIHGAIRSSNMIADKINMQLSKNN